MCLPIRRLIVFFFCKQKTAYEMRISDWSSDVCSSDLHSVSTPPTSAASAAPAPISRAACANTLALDEQAVATVMQGPRRPVACCTKWPSECGVCRIGASRSSEERRVGKECVGTGRSRWSPDHQQKKTTNTLYTNNKQ